MARTHLYNIGISCKGITVIISSNEVEGGELIHVSNIFGSLSFKFLANPNPNLPTGNMERKVVQ